MAVTKAVSGHSRTAGQSGPEPTSPDHGASLRRAALRVTLPRLAVLRTVASSAEHLTADQIRARLGAGGIELQRSSVFNVLAKLADGGLVRRVDLGGPTRFERLGASHDHFVCRSCLRIENVPPSRVRVPAVPDATVTETDVVHRGMCDECADD